MDVRLIAATNQDLQQLVAAGKFREDLYHRLDLYRISIPPLRARGDDLIQLAEMMIARLSQRHRLPANSRPPARQRLLAHNWPGNVRELAHEVGNAIVFEEGDRLTFERMILDTSVSYLTQKFEILWRHYWDKRRVWENTTRLNFDMNADNGPGYFKYRRYSAAEELD